MYKQGCGRQQMSGVWKHFKYDAVLNRSKYLVVDECGKGCETTLTGKFTTNLKAHLKVAHKAAYDECSKHDATVHQLTLSRKNPAHSSTRSKSVATVAPVSIKEHLGKAKAWPPESAETRKREHALTTMLIDTGLPVRLVDDASFRNFCASLDSKFKVPGDLIVLNS